RRPQRRRGAALGRAAGAGRAGRVARLAVPARSQLIQALQPPFDEGAEAVVDAGLLGHPQRLLEGAARLRELVVAALLEPVVADDDQLLDALGRLFGVDPGHATSILRGTWRRRSD